MKLITSILILGFWLALNNTYAASRRIEIPPGNYRIVCYNKDTGQLEEQEVNEKIQGLPYKAIEALVRSPQWIRKDLLRNFIELYKTPIKVGKGAKIALVDVSDDARIDLVVKSNAGSVCAFLAPYWKQQKVDAIKAIKFDDIAYHDVTGDGIKDKLSVSEDGTICYHKNLGTNSNPYYLVYNQSHKQVFNIKAGAQVRPAFGDLNGDGVTDLVVGNKTGEIKLYHGPDFKEEKVLPVKVTGWSKPVLCDVNQDGRLDLVVGCNDGKIYAFMGPQWEANDTIFKDVKVDSHSVPCFCDIDRDGDLDLCVGSADGEIMLFHKTPDGYIGQPEGFKGVKTGPFASPNFYDVNHDGQDDLVVGDSSGSVSLFLAPDWRPDTTTLLSVVTNEKFVTPSFADIDNDGAVELALGSASGKIMYYEYENGDWQEHNSWEYFRGTDALKNYYKIYYPEQEDLMGMNDNKTLMAYVKLLNKVESKYVDEIAFCIAQMPSEVLRAMNRLGGSDILVENVKQIYRLAQSLPYVKIVEEDDSTTLAYAVKPGVFKPAPRDIYYWWVVMPYLLWEIPARIDASYWSHDWQHYGISEEKWTRNTGGLKIYQRTPKSHFWRSFLPFDTRYGPALAGRLKDAPSVMHALCRISQFIRRENPGGIVPYGRRSADLQPMVIYMKSYGSCGEHSIIYCACLRAMLIPASIVEVNGEDHIWSDYWLDGKWYTFGDTLKMGTPAAETHNRRSIYTRYWSNGYTDEVTNLVSNIVPGAKSGYAETTELNIEVVDADGQGIDGALVLVRSHAYPSKRMAHHGYTDPRGRIRFNLGVLCKAYGGVLVDVLSPFGTGGITKLVPVKDKKYNYTIRLPGRADYYKEDQLDETISQPRGAYNVNVKFNVLSEYQYPKNPSTGIRRRSNSAFAKKLGYYGTRSYRRPNQSLNGSYVYLTDQTAVTGLINSGLMTVSQPVQRQTSGIISRRYGKLEDAVLVFFNRNNLHTYVEFEYELGISTDTNQPPEIVLEKCSDSAKVGERFLFRGSCRDNLRVRRLMFSHDNGFNYEDIAGSLDRQTGLWQYSWNTTRLAVGTYQVKFQVEDDEGLRNETPVLAISLTPSQHYEGIKVYQDNPKSPLPQSTWILGPFQLRGDEPLMEITARSTEKSGLDMDMYLYVDKNGNRMLDGTAEELNKSGIPAADEYIFVNQPNTSTVYWLYLHGWKVPYRAQDMPGLNKEQLLILKPDDLKNRYQYGLIDLNLSFEPQPVFIDKLGPVGVLYDGIPVVIKGKLVDSEKYQSVEVTLDGTSITRDLAWENNVFSYPLEAVDYARAITHTVEVYVMTEPGVKDRARWSFITQPRPDVIVHYKLDEAKEWMTISAIVKTGIELEYIKYRIDVKGQWKDIPQQELMVRKYVWRNVGRHKLIVEYKTGGITDTIITPFRIKRDRRSYGEQLEDIVIMPEDGMELNNSMVSIRIYLHKRLGTIDSLQVFLDEQEIQTLLSDYAWGKVAGYIPETPYAVGKHSVQVKVKNNQGKEFEKSSTFEIKPLE